MPNSATPTTLRSKVLLGFGSVFVMLVIIATISVRSTNSFIRTAGWVANANEAIETEERMLRHLTEMESSVRGYLATGDENFRHAHENSRSELVQAFTSLKVLLASETHQPQTIEQLQKLLQETSERDEAAIGARRRGDAAAGLTILRETEAVAATRRLNLLIDQAQNEERDILAERSDLIDRIASSTVSAVVAGSLMTIAALVIAGLLILRDLAARHRAEEALAQEHNLLSSIINAIPNHVYVKDAKGRFILDNTAHRHFLGLEETVSVEGRTDFDFFAKSVAAKFDADDHQVIQSGEPILGLEEQSLPDAGEQRETWLETNKVPLRDTDGKIVGLVGVSSDISARKLDEEKLRHFAEQLERSNTELQDFASVASHDLQEPLRKIQAFGDRLKVKCGPMLGAQGLDYLARMQNAAQRMQVLIQDLLKLSRVTSRAQPFQPCDLAEVVRQVLTDLEIAVEQSGARVEVGELPAIDADPLQMRQLFQNLIANALKFHKPGETPEVVIAARVFEVQEHLVKGALPGERVCQIRVADNGIGFDAKFAEQIFVVFQRLHTREEYEGTGIGLAVCRKITDRHGGSIVAKSAEGEGANFFITLPVKQLTAPHDK